MYKAHTDIKKSHWIEKFPASLRPYLYLARYDRPIGIWLLFLPCLWSFALENDWSLKLLSLFFFGAVLMRAAGCIINDLADQSFDKKVERTKTRPLATGAIKNKDALWFLVLHLSVSFLILFQLKTSTMLMGICFLPLVLVYPFMKRITYWPQLFLGITFNGGVLMAWIENRGYLALSPFLLYGAAVFWTLGYDTIYGCQDKEDDKTLGLKSTSLLFEKNLKTFLFICFSSMVSLLIVLGVLEKLSIFYHWIIVVSFGWLLYQVSFLDANNKDQILKLFKAQKWIGLWVWAAISLGKNIGVIDVF